MSVPLPQDTELERQVLGALLVRPELLVQVSSIIREEDFFLESHKLLYSTMLEMSVQGQAVDAIQVSQKLKDRALLQSVGDAATILSLAENVLTPASAPVIARRIKTIATRRDLILTVREIEELAGAPQEDENLFLKSVSDRILKITNRSSSEGIVHVRDIKNDFSRYIEGLVKAKGGITGLETGYTEFDNLTTGLKGGELIVLAARPGAGKTTLAMNMAGNIAVKNGNPVLIFSMEMGRMELLMRMLCSYTQMNLGDLKKGIIPRNRSEQVLNGIDRITSSPISIDDSGTSDIWDIITMTRRLGAELEQRGQKLGLVIVDYLQLVADPEAKKHGRQNEVASVSRSMKQLARMVDVPIIAVSQMNRSVEQRKGDSARPQLSDLRESGAIEQDADMVLFIHREQYDDESPEAMENRGTAEIIIAKHRNGPTGSFRLAYRPEMNRFDNKPSVMMEAER